MYLAIDTSTKKKLKIRIMQLNRMLTPYLDFSLSPLAFYVLCVSNSSLSVSFREFLLLSMSLSHSYTHPILNDPIACLL